MNDFNPERSSITYPKHDFNIQVCEGNMLESSNRIIKALVATIPKDFSKDKLYDYLKINKIMIGHEVYSDKFRHVMDPYGSYPETYKSIVFRSTGKYVNEEAPIDIKYDIFISEEIKDLKQDSDGTFKIIRYLKEKDNLDIAKENAQKFVDRLKDKT